MRGGSGIRIAVVAGRVGSLCVPFRLLVYVSQNGKGEIGKYTWPWRMRWKITRGFGGEI